mmetsp:Transcript_62315/g.110737  ORF Transcript_62315/g.110737 Transcript_62315/m.110737 type:complete len:248 (-) Transcript_62315:143-886(-)
MIISSDLFHVDLHIRSLHALGSGIAPVVLVKIFQQSRHLIHSRDVLFEVHAADVELQGHVCLSAIRTLKESAANASEPDLGVAVICDAAHVVARFAQDAFHETEFFIVLQTYLKDTNVLQAVTFNLTPRQNQCCAPFRTETRIIFVEICTSTSTSSPTSPALAFLNANTPDMNVSCLGLARLFWICHRTAEVQIAVRVLCDLRRRHEARINGCRPTKRMRGSRTVKVSKRQQSVVLQGASGRLQQGV